MAIRLVHALHVLLILESGWGKVVSEDLGEAVRHGADASPGAEERAFAHRGAARDMVSISMFKVYERYSKEPQSQRDGNTVRSFKAVPSEWLRFITQSSSEQKWRRESLEEFIGVFIIYLPAT